MERCAQATVCTDARHQPTPELNDETIGQRRSGLLSTILILEYSSATLPSVSVLLHERGTEDKGVSVAVQLQLTGVVFHQHDGGGGQAKYLSCLGSHLHIHTFVQYILPYLPPLHHTSLSLTICWMVGLFALVYIVHIACCYRTRLVDVC